jgi:hypothetical protein
VTVAKKDKMNKIKSKTIIFSTEGQVGCGCPDRRMLAIQITEKKMKLPINGISAFFILSSFPKSI